MLLLLLLIMVILGFFDSTTTTTTMATNHNSNHGGGEEVDNEKEGVEWRIAHLNELIGGTERRSGAHYGILGQMDCGDVVVAHDVCVDHPANKTTSKLALNSSIG